MPSRRRVFATGAALLAAPPLIRSARAQQQTLRLHHFLPAVSNVHRNFLQPWAQKIATETNGALRIQIFPAMQLGGAPPQLYDQARDGVADIVWTLPGSTPGRFPRMEVIELPYVAHARADVNSKVVQDLFEKHLKDEFRETHLITAWAHDAGHIHARKAVANQDDLRGLKLRFPTRLAGEALRALGAAPVGMPVPQVPEALSQGVIDGAVVPWEVVPAVRLQELVKFHTIMPGSPTFYTTSFVLAMNPARYAGLPAELKTVLDANSGQVGAAMAAAAWDNQAPVVEELVRKRGNTVTVLADAEKARWQTATRPVVDAWVGQTKERNIDGAALLAETQALVAKHGGA